VSCKVLVIVLALGTGLVVPSFVQAQPTSQQNTTSDSTSTQTKSTQSTSSQPKSTQSVPAQPTASQPAPSRGTSSQTGNQKSGGTQDGPRQLPPHPAETNPGQTPHGSSNAGAIAGAAAGAAVGTAIIVEIIKHHNASPEKLGHDGPEVPKDIDMNGFALKGLAGPNWPVVLDFKVDSPGSVQLDIITADNKHHYQATMTNAPNRRAYGIIHLPPDFGNKIQVAAYQIRSIAGAGSTAPPPQLRTYGLGAGEKAVGSVAIDQLTFQPATIHPSAREVATYSFHAHSAFDGVRAEFIFTTLYNGHVVAEKDQEAKLPPIPQGEQSRGTWEGKGKPGEHMLQVRAWRGLENGGDWVVAWSPDIVDVVK
jgi:hypothetical protein